MTLEEARELVGEPVTYRAPHEPPPGTERGTLTEVRGDLVFVKFGADGSAKACPPDSLTRG